MISAFNVLTRLTRLMFLPALNVRKRLVIGVVCEIATILFAVLVPYLLKRAVDLLAARESDRITLILVLVAFALLSSSAGLSAAIRHRAASGIVEAIAGFLSVRLMQGQLPHLARDLKADSADLTGRLERLPYNLQILVDGILWQTAPLLLQTLMSLIVILVLVPGYYATIIGLSLAAYLLSTWRGAGPFKKEIEYSNAETVTTSLLVADVLRNARRVVLNGNLASELSEVAVQLSRRRVAHARSTKSLTSMAALQYAVVALASALLLLLAAMDVDDGRLTAGDFVLVQAYMFQLLLPVGSFAFLLRQSSRAIGQMQELFDLVGGTKAITASPVPRLNASAAIILKSVGYRYADGSGGVSGIDAAIVAGSFVVIIGANGSGKSTLARIMAGHLPPTEGTISIGGLSIADFPAADGHLPVHYVPQHVSLFNRSLGANGLYPPTRLTADALSALLGEWRFYDDGHLPDLSRLVGEQGEQLSGGQVQKLELARLTGVGAPIMILDETTSSLDPHSEKQVIGALRKKQSGRTTLILITHSHELAEQADQVLFLHNGTITCSGTHQALMLRPEYRDFWAGDQKAAS